MLNVVDEFTHECIAIRIERKLKSIDVVDVLSDLFMTRGVPEHVRSDNGPEFIATAVQKWITEVGAKTAYIAPGSPWGETRLQSIQLIDCRVERLRRELQCKTAR
jgi:putative transposase